MWTLLDSVNNMRWIPSGHSSSSVWKAKNAKNGTSSGNTPGHLLTKWRCAQTPRHSVVWTLVLLLCLCVRVCVYIF